MRFTLLVTNLVLLVRAASFAQEEQNKADFKVHLGIKYTLLEYRGGPSIASILLLPNKLNISLRKDFLIGLGSLDNGLTYQVVDYYTYNYLDFGYRLMDGKITVGAGGAWVYKGEGENELFDRTTGYYAISTFVTRRIEPFYLEIRGDIPLGENQEIYNQGYLFPISLCLSYRFPEKRCTEE